MGVGRRRARELRKHEHEREREREHDHAHKCERERELTHKCEREREFEHESECEREWPLSASVLSSHNIVNATILVKKNNVFLCARAWVMCCKRGKVQRHVDLATWACDLWGD